MNSDDEETCRRLAEAMTPTAASRPSSLAPDRKALLNTRLTEIPMSVRTSNVLRFAGIERLGDLALQTEQSLLSLQNCGRKSVNEIKQLLEMRGLRLGMSMEAWEELRENGGIEEPVEPPAPRLFADYPPEVRDVFFLKVEELGLSQRALNICARLKLRLVGDLVRVYRGVLCKTDACGTNTMVEIQERLALLGLELGMDIEDWGTPEARLDQQGRERLEKMRLSLSSLPPTSCLEDELQQIASVVDDERATDIVIKLSGFGGVGRRTLESVGTEYGITRERVRQIAAKAEKKLKHRKFATPWLTQAIELLEGATPCIGTELSRLLKERGVSRADFDLGGISAACKMFGRKLELERASFGDQVIYGMPKSLRKSRLFFRECKRATSRAGCANFQAICDDIRADPQERSFLRKIATIGGKCTWLDDERQWLLVSSATRNRLSNLVSKVFSVARRLPLSELRRAVSRSRRLEVIPPTGVLARFIEVAGLGKVDGDIASAAPGFKDTIRPGSNEETLILVLQLHGPVLGWDRLQELCIASGMNPITFGIYASASPVLARLARGVYSLVGADIAPGVVEEVLKESSASRRKAEWGWTSQGSLWCALPLTLTTIVSGACPVPTFVEKMTEGEWHAFVGEKPIETPLKCRAGFISGLRRPLENIGAEAGDMCIIEFQLAHRRANVFVGGEELVDLLDSGKIDITTAETDEFDEEDSEDDGILLETP